MGSDLFMSPPQKKWEWFTNLSEEEAMSYVLGAMANKYEARVEPLGDGQWRVGVWKGVWTG